MKRFKRIIKQFPFTILIAAVLCDCATTAKDILKKYDAYSVVEADANKAGVQLKVSDSLLMISYSLPLLNTSEEYIKTLAGRWFIANAEKPDVRFPVKASMTMADSAAIYGHQFDIDSIKARFLLIGFEGIDSLESDVAKTSPLFFLVEKNKKERKLLSGEPRLANDLFTANYELTRFVVYSTLTVKKFNFGVSGWQDIKFQSINIEDENEVKITVPDVNEWFENAKLKGNISIYGSITMTFDSNGPSKVTLSKDSKFMFDYIIDEKVYVVTLIVGSKLFTEKTSTGKYILLPEETAKLSSKPIIVLSSK